VALIVSGKTLSIMLILIFTIFDVTFWLIHIYVRKDPNII